MNTTTRTDTRTRSSETTPRPSTAGIAGTIARYERTPAVVAAEAGAAVGLAATAYIHLAEMSDKFAEVPYLGIGYLLLSVACVVSIVLIASRNKAGWYLGGATAAATFIGFVLTRTVGLPQSTDDIGNWSESIGTWSLVAEGLVVMLAAVMITLHLRKPAARLA